MKQGVPAEVAAGKSFNPAVLCPGASYRNSLLRHLRLLAADARLRSFPGWIVGLMALMRVDAWHAVAAGRRQAHPARPGASRRRLWRPRSEQPTPHQCRRLRISGMARGRVPHLLPLADSADARCQLSADEKQA